MRIQLLLICVFYLFLSSYSYGADEIYTRFFSDKAVGGYDVVSYFQDGGPKKGQDGITYTYKGAAWHFVSVENKALFQESPAKYAPQYGGYCAWAVSEKGSLVSADPLQWTVREGKLYLNYNKTVKENWLVDTSDFIQKADKNWPNLID